MTWYIIKRIGYCLFIVAGVVMLTFLLFNVAAGDPAAAVLGKNPSPQEIEDLRRELGSDLPLFAGSWRSSEAFTPYNAATGNLPANAGITGTPEVIGSKLHLAPGEAFTITRNFPTPGESGLFIIDYKGDILLNGEPFGREKLIVPEVDAVTIAAGGEGAEITSCNFMRPNQSVWNSQFIRTLKEICTFSAEPPYVSFLNFGKTLITREPIGDIILRGVWPSLMLMIPIFLGELVLGIILALLATAAKDTFIDRLILAGSISMMSISYLVVIIFAQWSLGYYYNFFPVWGWGGVEYLVLPVLIGIVCGLGGSVRFYRSVFVNELNKEYLRTAKAKGCSPIAIYNKHLLRNALIPIITRAASVLPFLFTGSLLLESFFGIPGLGYAGLDAIYNSDLQLLKALVIVSALLFVFINLLTDIAYAWADPRIRLK